MLSRKDQPLSVAIAVETCLAPLAKFQHASNASPAPRGRSAAHLYSCLCSRARRRRACLLAAGSRLSGAPRDVRTRETGRGGRNSMKISARRDGDHARRAGSRPAARRTSSIAPVPARSRCYGGGLPVVFQRLSVATGLAARGAAFARPGGGPDAVWRSPDLAIGDRPRDSVDARRPRRGRF